MTIKFTNLKLIIFKKLHSRYFTSSDNVYDPLPLLSLFFYLKIYIFRYLMVNIFWGKRERERIFFYFFSNAISL
jgi:hypothetical protein